MLIQSKRDGSKHRAIRLKYDHLITDKGEIILAKDCLVFGENTWWRFEQVQLRTSESFFPVGLSLPDSFKLIETDIVSVKLPERIANIINLNCITPK